MLTAEQVSAKITKGYTKYEWTKLRPRNEALDCRIIARAVASNYGVDRWTPAHWSERAEFLGVGMPDAAPSPEAGREAPDTPQETRAEPSKSAQQQAIKRRKSSYW